MVSELNCHSLHRLQTLVYSALPSAVAMGRVQSQELEESGNPFPILNSILDASLGKEDIYTERETKNEKTSLEVTERKHLIHGPVKLTNGWHRKKRHLFLFSDALLILNSRYKKIFKVEHIIPLQNLWMDKVEEGHNSAKKSFYLGWPMENFRATFPSSEQKEKWHSFLERSISLIKEKDHQKSVELQIFIKDIQHSPVAVTASSTDTVNGIIKKTLSMLGISGCEKEYLLSFISGKEEAPFTLIGHEYLYTIKMNHLRYKASMPQGPRKLASRTLQDSFQEQMSPDLEGYFFLQPKHPPKGK
ncbi:rho GTPase-activating protein 20-like isoform X1 [Castor canadensis]|uniref:Rho GTPase-activating protein 20-like isoform X1 n=1 Tax=Castor canadensis TaxID=51338 RepID=A0AC58KU81_CASCN